MAANWQDSRLVTLNKRSFWVVADFIFWFSCRLKDDYLAAIDAMVKHLLRYSEPNKMTYIGEVLNEKSFSPKMVYCFNNYANLSKYKRIFFC